MAFRTAWCWGACPVFARCGGQCPPAGAHGWNVNGWWPGGLVSSPGSTPFPFAFVVGVGWSPGVGVVPWSMAHCWVLRQQALPLTPPCGGCGGWLLSGPGRGCATRFSLVPWGWGGVWWRRLTGLLFGNCIVDASILQFFCRSSDFFRDPGAAALVVVPGFFDHALLGLFVVKFSRAHGGCLGIRSR